MRKQRTERTPLATAALLAAYAALLLVAAFIADGATASAAREVRDPQLTPVMRRVTSVGDSSVCTALVAAAVAVAVAARRLPRTPILAAYIAAPLATGLLADAVKVLARRERPAGVALADAPSFAFPSSHAARAAVTAVVVVAILVPFGRTTMRTAAVAAAVVATAVGLSRIYLGVHFLSDVVGGWLLGALCGLAIVSLLRRGTRPAAMHFIRTRRTPGG